MLLKPIQSLSENFTLFLWSLPLAIGVTILDAFQSLVMVETKLAVGLVVVVFIDLMSGMMKARRDGKKISSLGLRQTGIKIVEYTMVCLCFVILSNMSDSMNFIRHVPFLFLVMIEIKSIVENLSDEKGTAHALFDYIKKLMDTRKP